MKTKRLTWSLIILGLSVGFNTFALGKEEKARKSPTQSDPPDQVALFSKKDDQVSKGSVDHSVVKIADDQQGRSFKKVGPLYQPPRRGAPGGRVGGGTRGPSTNLPFLYALVPDHVAMTAEEQPHLVWYLSKTTSLPLELTVVEGIGVEPILEVALPTPTDAGIQMISLVQYDTRLEPGKTYQWFVSLIPDPTRRSKDVIAGGMLEVDKLPYGLSDEVKQANPLNATKLLAKAGFWYDAMGMISNEIQANPKDQALREIRAALLKEVDLSLVAQVDQKSGL